MYSLNEKIRIIRNIRGYKQSYLASKLGISQQDYSYKENSGKNFSQRQITIIAETLRVDVKFLEEFNPDILLIKAQQEESVKEIITSGLSNIEAEGKIVTLLKKQISLLENNIKGLRNQISEQNETIKELRLMLQTKRKKLKPKKFV